MQLHAPWGVDAQQAELSPVIALYSVVALMVSVEEVESIVSACAG